MHFSLPLFALRPVADLSREPLERLGQRVREGVDGSLDERHVSDRVCHDRGVHGPADVKLIDGRAECTAIPPVCS